MVANRRISPTSFATLALACIVIALAPAAARADDVPCNFDDPPCHLAFTTQPADVLVGDPITGSPAGSAGPPIAVSILDPANNVVTIARDITLTLATAPPAATLNGTTTVLSVDGVATFPGLSVTQPGVYRLNAATPDAGAVISNAFRAFDALTACVNNVSCSASASVEGLVPGTVTPYTNTVEVTAAANPDPGVPEDGGLLAAAFNVGPNFTCGNAAFASPDREVINGPNREKVVRSNVAKALLTAAGRSASSLRTCLVAPYRFNLGLPLIGGRATPVGDIDSDGHPDFIGLLPKCRSLPFPIFGITTLIGPPCQVSAIADPAGNGIVTYRLPADSRDPAARH